MGFGIGDWIWELGIMIRDLGLVLGSGIEEWGLGIGILTGISLNTNIAKIAKLSLKWLSLRSESA